MSNLKPKCFELLSPQKTPVKLLWLFLVLHSWISLDKNPNENEVRVKLVNWRDSETSSVTLVMVFLGWWGWWRGHDDWHGPLSCMQLNRHVHIQQWYWPLTPSPVAITILESHRASGPVHNTININVLWLGRLWRNFLPHQYWWCCHTLESGSSLRIYRRNTGGGGSVCEGALCHF